MFEDDLVVDVVDSIRVETLAGTVLFRVPLNAVQLFEESYWGFVEYLQSKNINIAAVTFLKNVFTVSIDNRREELFKGEIVPVHTYMSMSSIPLNVVRYDPTLAAKFVFRHKCIVDNMSPAVWKSTIFINRLINIVAGFMRSDRKNGDTCIDRMLEKCDKKMFRRKSILKSVCKIFHLLNIEQRKRLNISRQTFSQWLKDKNGICGRFHHLWVCDAMHESELEVPDGFMNRYVNVENILIWMRKLVPITTKKGMIKLLTPLPREFTEHPAIKFSLATLRWYPEPSH